MCLNCCGLNLRLNYPEFGELICQHDFICLQETKTDDTDQINFPGYIFKTKNRQKFSHRKSGGIAFGYKEKLDKFITIIKNDNKFVFWVKVSSTLFKLDEDVLIGVVYIPPEFTSYSSQEAFNNIYFDIRYFSRLHEYISLAVNCNARITEFNDFSVFTENYFLNEDKYLIEKCISFLTDSNLPLKKHGLDKGQNKSGKLLINLCKGQRFCAMNGRVGHIR